MQIRGPTASSLLDHLIGAAECLRRFALPSIADEIISSQRRHRIRVTPRSVRRPNLQLRNTLCSEPSAVRPNRNASDAAFLLMPMPRGRAWQGAASLPAKSNSSNRGFAGVPVAAHFARAGPVFVYLLAPHLRSGIFHDLYSGISRGPDLLLHGPDLCLGILYRLCLGILFGP